MIKRVAVLIGLLLATAGFFAVPSAQGETNPNDIRVQERAADEVMAQLEASDEPMEMEEIEGLAEMGPAPWLSYTPGRSRKVVAAWVEVAEQLPTETMAAASDTQPGDPAPITFTESEKPDETGGNDTPETGDRIDGFGTYPGKARVVTINGNLSGADIQIPIDYDCPSVEDDGAIPLANEAGPNVVFGALCGGAIGDGPHGASTGDTDFYSFGEVEAGSLLVLDVLHISESLQPVNAVLGIYDADGNLLASGEDAGDPNAPDNPFLLFEATEDGVYYGVIAGCCELPTDPFDATSGAGVTETGTYDMFVVAVPPPCSSSEDDGSITAANQTNVEVAEFEFCAGDIGDGPHGASTGDTDFYSVGTAEAGNLIVGDLVNLDGLPDFVNGVIGIYDADGNLLTSAEDSGDPEAPEFVEYEVTEAGEYFVGLAGCCELQSDPFDATSGAGVTETGSYQLAVGSLPPPPPLCESLEDDGAIPLANATEEAGNGDDELFVTLCFGSIGDGPQAGTGDVDFYTTREMTEGKILVVDFVGPPDSVAGDFVIGIYDDAGTLLESGQDSPDPNDRNFFEFTVPATGTYHVVVSGGLPSDPFDSTSGTNTDLVGDYDVFLVDITRELLDEIIGPDGGNWRTREIQNAIAEAAASSDGTQREAVAALLDARRAEEGGDGDGDGDDPGEPEEPVVDTDVFLVDLKAGDVISGGFDSARVTGILDPVGVGRMASSINPSFIYPADSFVRHDRRIGFDHVVADTGTHAIFVSEGVGPYEGELRIARSGLADVPGDDQQIIFLDFDGAAVSPGIFGPPGGDPVPEEDLSPLSAFLAAWGLDPSDEDDVIDATIDATIENLDTDLRVLDGRNGDRDASGKPTEFDIEILNSRDHGDRWGDPNVSRVVVGGTIDELQIPTIGIAQSIDPGNLETEETGVVLLDLLSAPAGDLVSLNTYGLAPGQTKSVFVGYSVGHIVAHEVGHFIGNWHTETFNEQVSLMDAGGEFESVFGVGADGIFGSADDVDADFAEDIFNSFEGFGGVEDTAARSVFALSTGNIEPGNPGKASVSGSVTDTNGAPVADVAIDFFTATEDGERISYLGTVRSDSDGRYGVEGEPGCYSIVFIAPAGSTFVGGSQWNQQSVCLEAGESDDSISAVLVATDPGDESRIGGQVTNADGSGAEVVVDLFSTNGDGSRAAFLGDTTSDADGNYGFDVAPGCYVTVMIAPDGHTFGGSKWNQQSVCVKAGEVNDDVDGQLD